MVVLTGNNIAANGAEFATRVLETRLVNPPGQNLALREFRHTNLMKWTLLNREKIAGAYTALLSVEASDVETAGRFPGWERIVAAPLIKVSGVEDFFAPWIEAGDEADAGIARPAIDALAIMMSCAEFDAEPMPKDGVWMSPQEWLDAVPQSYWENANYGDPVVTAQTVRKVLNANRDVLLDGQYRIKQEHAHLSRMKNDRHKRQVFKIIRTDEAAPENPEKKMAESMGQKIVTLPDRR